MQKEETPEFSGKMAQKISMKAGGALLAVGAGLGLLAGLGFSQLIDGEPQTAASPGSSANVSAASTPSIYEPWETHEQEQAVATAASVLSAYITPYESVVSWQDSMGIYGTERFKNWAEAADPSWVFQGQVLSVAETDFPNSFEATVTLKTTVGTYPIKLVQVDGQVLVDEIVRQ